MGAGKRMGAVLGLGVESGRGRGGGAARLVRGIEKGLSSPPGNRDGTRGRSVAGAPYRRHLWAKYCLLSVSVLFLRVCIECAFDVWGAGYEG
jgi:hypothetical protein